MPFTSGVSSRPNINERVHDAVEFLGLPQVGVEVFLDEFGQNPLVLVETLKVVDDGVGMPLDDRLDHGNGVGDDLRCQGQVDLTVVVGIDAAEFIHDLFVNNVVIDGAASAERSAPPRAKPD
jgi:hypothetical protein